MENSINVPCKINLQLDVGEKKDNYHQIYTVMQTVSLFDKLTFNIDKFQKNNKIILTCNKPYIPVDNKNLCYQAIEYFTKKFNITDNIHLDIKKYIPSGGGLGGGSSNFFYTLYYLNKYYKTKLSLNQMQEICNQFGSDISFFSIGGTCLCTGRGEIIKPINNFPQCSILLVNPNIPISTKEIYNNFDNEIKIDYNSQINEFYTHINSSKKTNLKSLIPNLFNALESVAIKQQPVIAEIKNTLNKNGALTSLMSGSGSTVYGIFNNFFTAKNCQFKFMKYKKYFTIICKPIFPKFIY